jgi:hypothetical protein
MHGASTQQESLSERRSMGHPILRLIPGYLRVIKAPFSAIVPVIQSRDAQLPIGIASANTAVDIRLPLIKSYQV